MGGRGRVTCGVCGFNALNSNLMQKHYDKWHISANEDSLSQPQTSHSQTKPIESTVKGVVKSPFKTDHHSMLKTPQVEVCSEDEADLGFGNPRKKCSGRTNASSRMVKFAERV